MSNAAENLSDVRKVAVRTLMAVTLKSRPFDIALDEMAAEAKLNARGRAFAFNLVMLSLRQLGVLRHTLQGLLDRGLPKNATWTEAALITGLAQILFMRTADHAAVNETVELVKSLSGKEKGFAGLVNAVLRKAIKKRDDLLSEADKHPERNLPQWLQTSWAETYTEGTMRAIAQTLASNPPLDISIKPAQLTEDMAEKLRATPLPTGTLRRDATDVTSLEGYDEGSWWVQDMAAAIPATLLGNIEGKHVLDMCAAPGGKTMQLAARGARVTAIDRNKNRLRRLHANLERTKLAAEVAQADAATFEPVQPVDHILLDAPCSATGTLRRNPDVIWTKEPTDVAKLANLQAKILRHAFALLPVGGTLIYCVCSLEKSEGVEQVDAFLSDFPAAKRVPVSPDEVGGLGELLTDAGDLLCLPSLQVEKGGMDGFFAARLTKVK
ncbi:MAG: methyltransferase domain-containing protein [Kordiimonadaceae bacterium]|nr:methyltransferase domain-containing protein [Kordiimonadaceae bacterium]MBO6568206.1 methyltransferase domain-containing protein [Kordiimonadaceae bacterium]MBO6964064.1 methyltransferase domain-containing protein [Kordiimonadaceae bacterium]